MRNVYPPPRRLVAYGVSKLCISITKTASAALLGSLVCVRTTWYYLRVLTDFRVRVCVHRFHTRGDEEK